MILWHNQRRRTHAERTRDDHEPSASCRPDRRHEDEAPESVLFPLADLPRRTER